MYSDRFFPPAWWYDPEYEDVFYLSRDEEDPDAGRDEIEIEEED